MKTSFTIRAVAVALVAALAFNPAAAFAGAPAAGDVERTRSFRDLQNFGTSVDGSGTAGCEGESCACPTCPKPTLTDKGPELRPERAIPGPQIGKDKRPEGAKKEGMMSKAGGFFKENALWMGGGALAGGVIGFMLGGGIFGAIIGALVGAVAGVLVKKVAGGLFGKKKD